MLGKGAADQGCSADSQDGALAEMKLALAAQGNSNITASGVSSVVAGAENSSAGWAKATAEINRRNGFND